MGNQQHFDQLRLIRSPDKRGQLIAEQPPGTEPRARHSTYRCRRIARLAMGSAVVKAAPKSGSLITTRLPAEAGREVMAVPGSALDPRSHGYNELIREGATLVLSAAEIAERVTPDRFPHETPSSTTAEAAIAADGDGAEPKAVIDFMVMTYISAGKLVRQSGSRQSVVQMVPLEIELAEKLEHGAGGKVCLAA